MCHLADGAVKAAQRDSLFVLLRLKLNVAGGVNLILKGIVGGQSVEGVLHKRFLSQSVHYLMSFMFR